MDNEIKSSDIVLISNGHPLCEISIKTLVGYLEANGINCRSIYINSTSGLKVSEIQELLKLCHGSKLVGFSMMSKDVKKLLPLVNTIREMGIPTVWGGIHPTASPEDSLKYCDFICTGEGEFTLLSLYKEIVSGTKNFSSIPNLGFNKNSKPVLPAIFRTEAFLDDLPYPDYEFLDGYFLKNGLIQKIPSSIDERKTFFGMSLFLFYSARGCPNACSYCSNSLYHQIAKKTKTKWYRALSPSRIKDEVRHYLKYLPVDFFWFNDDNFMIRDPEEIEEICKFIKEELNVPFNINATPNVVTVEKMEILTRYGIRQIAFGIQSGSDNILKKVYNRFMLSDTVRNAANIVAEFYKYGVIADYGFILENPYENAEDLRRTFRLFLDLPQPVNLSLYSLAFFPGTQLTLKALEEGVIEENQISINKDYRDSISPSFVHVLFNAFYTLKIPKSLYDFLLSDEIFIAEDGHYARLLMSNYFINEKIRQIGENRMKQYKQTSDFKKIKSTSGLKAALFWITVKAVFENYKNPTEVTTDSINEDIVLKYPDSIEIGFSEGQIVRWSEPGEEIKYFDKKAIESAFLKNKFYHMNRNTRITLKYIIKYPRRAFKECWRYPKKIF